MNKRIGMKTEGSVERIKIPEKNEIETLKMTEHLLTGYEEEIPKELVIGIQQNVKGGRYKCQSAWFADVVLAIGYTRDNILFRKGSDEEAGSAADLLGRYSSIFCRNEFHDRERTTPEQIILANEALKLCLVELKKLSK